MQLRNVIHSLQRLVLPSTLACTALTGCFPSESDEDTGATPGTSSATTGESEGDTDPTDAGTTGGEPDGSTGTPPEGTTTGDDATTGTDPGDGVVACSTAWLFAGNPHGLPGSMPSDGASLIDMTPDGPNLPARKIAISPSNPNQMVAATGAELWAIDAEADTLTRILGNREDALFRPGTCDVARIGIVSDIAFGADGTLYAGDHSGNAVVAISDPFGAGCEMTSVAGTSMETGIDSLPYEPDFVDGPGEQARFAGPDFLTVSSSGDVFVVDTGNVAIRRIDAAGMVSTVAELPSDYVGFGSLSAFAIAEVGGKLYLPVKGSVQSSQNATILEVDPDSGELREVATGRDEPWLVGSSGPAIAGLEPIEGSLVMTWVNGRLFTVDVQSGEVTHVAGNGEGDWGTADIPDDYDAYGEHDAFDVVLHNLSASTSGASTYLTYADGTLYFSGHARGQYVEGIDCE